MGDRITVGSFFKYHANKLSQKLVLLSKSWLRGSLKNVVPPWIEMMNENQEFSDSALDKTIRRDRELSIDQRIRVYTAVAWIA